MHWPQITAIFLLWLQLALYGVKHGEERGKFNMGGAFVDVSAWAFILYEGGFFS